MTAVVTYHNEPAEMIGRCLSAIAAQTIPVERVIIVDDGSRSERALLVRELAAQYGNVEVQRFQAATGGPSSGRNLGWDLAATEWVAFCDASDAWHPGRIERQLRVAAETEASVVSAEFDSVDEDFAWPELPEKIRHREVGVRHMLIKNRLHTSSVLVRADSPVRFDPDRNASEDMECWIALAATHGGTRVMDDVLSVAVEETWYSGGLSSRIGLMAREEYRTFTLSRKNGHITLSQQLFAQAFLTVRLARRFARMGIHRMRSR